MSSNGIKQVLAAGLHLKLTVYKTAYLRYSNLFKGYLYLFHENHCSKMGQGSSEISCMIRVLIIAWLLLGVHHAKRRDCCWHFLTASCRSCKPSLFRQMKETSDGLELIFFQSRCDWKAICNVQEEKIQTKSEDFVTFSHCHYVLWFCIRTGSTRISQKQTNSGFGNLGSPCHTHTRRSRTN